MAQLFGLDYSPSFAASSVGLGLALFRRGPEVNSRRLIFVMALAEPTSSLSSFALAPLPAFSSPSGARPSIMRTSHLATEEMVFLN